MIANEILRIRDAVGFKAFADGGLHSGGLRLVGELGPELEATGPARIYSAEQTRNLLSGGDHSESLLAVNRAQLAELKTLKTDMQNMRQTIKTLDDRLRAVIRDEDGNKRLMVGTPGLEPLPVEVANTVTVQGTVTAL